MLAQWKSDGLITRKSLDRNEDMLMFFLCRYHLGMMSLQKSYYPGMSIDVANSLGPLCSFLRTLLCLLGSLIYKGPLTAQHPFFITHELEVLVSLSSLQFEWAVLWWRWHTGFVIFTPSDPTYFLIEGIHWITEFLPSPDRDKIPGSHFRALASIYY